MANVTWNLSNSLPKQRQLFGRSCWLLSGDAPGAAPFSAGGNDDTHRHGFIHPKKMRIKGSHVFVGGMDLNLDSRKQSA